MPTLICHGGKRDVFSVESCCSISSHIPGIHADLLFSRCLLVIMIELQAVDSSIFDFLQRLILKYQVRSQEKISFFLVGKKKYLNKLEWDFQQNHPLNCFHLGNCWMFQRHGKLVCLVSYLSTIEILSETGMAKSLCLKNIHFEKLQVNLAVVWLITIKVF